MPLKSNLFEGSERLNAALVSDPAHITPGSRGQHVADIQIALQSLDDAVINAGEIASQTYGPSTAAAVLAFKKKRNIVNRAYQQSADNVVGKMTIAAIDQELYDAQYTPKPHHAAPCRKGGIPPLEIREPMPLTIPAHIAASWPRDE